MVNYIPNALYRRLGQLNKVEGDYTSLKLAPKNLFYFGEEPPLEIRIIKGIVSI